MDTDKAKTLVSQTLATFFHRADLAGLHITEQAALLRCTTSTCYRLRKEARPELLASTSGTRPLPSGGRMGGSPRCTCTA